MKPIEIPETMNIYLLLKQSGLVFVPAGISHRSPGCVGVYYSMQDAEVQRTIEILSSANQSDIYHIFELEVPNPAYKK